jgi:hypothetical protein
MEYVLIIWLYGTAIGTHDFNSQAACVSALQQWNEQVKRNGTGFCIPK